MSARSHDSYLSDAFLGTESSLSSDNGIHMYVYMYMYMYTCSRSNSRGNCEVCWYIPSTSPQYCTQEFQDDSIYVCTTDRTTVHVHVYNVYRVMY